MDEWMDGQMDRLIDGWKMDECMDNRMGGYMDG